MLLHEQSSSTSDKELLELHKDHTRGNIKALSEKVNNYVMNLLAGAATLPIIGIKFACFPFSQSVL